ncbi:MAG: hypothetical protein ACQET0_08110 [Pseudomonadota bacterium]
MTRRLLEINDVALLAADADGNLVTSPGQIICGEGAREPLRVGRAASERRRINPRATHDRFWAALDQAPLPYAAGPARSNADLVWLHLRELLTALDRDEQDRWTFVVPAAYGDEQLALLLGIAGSLDIRVERLVSAPVIAAAAAGTDIHSVVIDAHWHRFSTDRVAASGPGHRLDPDGVLDSRAPGARGLGALFDAWANAVNDAFVSQTRFDPSHDAVVEQGLYNRLPGWLARMERGEEVVAELDVGEHRYRAELPAGAFIAAAEPFYRGLTDRIRQAGADTLVLRHRLAGLPGLAQCIVGAGFAEPRWVDQEAVVRAALELPAAGTGGADGAVPLTLALGGGPASDAGYSHDRVPAGASVPTHVLIDGSALAVDGAGRALSAHWQLVREPDGRVVLVGDADAPEHSPAAINGRPAASRAALASGDRVVIGDDEFVLLRVADSGVDNPRVDNPGVDDSEVEDRGPS